MDKYKSMQDYLEYYLSKKTINELLGGMGAESIKDMVDTKEVYGEIYSALMAEDIRNFLKEPNINREPNPHANKIIMFPVPRITDKDIKKYIGKKYL